MPGEVGGASQPQQLRSNGRFSLARDWDFTFANRRSGYGGSGGDNNVHLFESSGKILCHFAFGFHGAKIIHREQLVAELEMATDVLAILRSPGGEICFRFMIAARFGDNGGGSASSTEVTKFGSETSWISAPSVWKTLQQLRPSAARRHRASQRRSVWASRGGIARAGSRVASDDRGAPRPSDISLRLIPGRRRHR